jgi:type II secretory pathway component PulF
LGQEYALEKKVKGALMYPSLVMTAALGLGAFISLYILPQLVDFFSAFESKLPLSTIVLLRVAQFMKSYGLIVFGILFSTIILTFFLIRLPKVKPYWHSFILKLPLFGNLLRERELSRFSRNLGTLIKSGLPVFEALEITSRSQTNLSYRSSIIKLSQSLEKGRSLADTLKSSTSSFLFPRLVADMISVGEKTGTIDESLIYVSQFYQDDIEETARNLTTILEPAILIIIGLMVAFLAFAIIGPIYQLTGAIG